jgi:hypothetical protein
MSESLTLSTPRPAVVTFHGHDLLTAEVNGVPHVAMRPLVEAIGLAWQAQHVKLTANPAKWSVTMIVTVASDGCSREQVCIPLRKLNGWLFSIDADRVSPELHEQIVMYQDECFEVLHDYWAGKRRVFSPDLQNRLWFEGNPVLTTPQLAAALRATDVQLRHRKDKNTAFLRERRDWYTVPATDIPQLRAQAAAVFACPITPGTSKLTVWTQTGARAMAMLLGTRTAHSLYAQLERTYFAEKPTNHRPGTSIAEALATAERMLVELKTNMHALSQVNSILHA